MLQPPRRGSAALALLCGPRTLDGSEPRQQHRRKGGGKVLSMLSVVLKKGALNARNGEQPGLAACAACALLESAAHVLPRWL